jgi:alkylated DNA repair dioxygenase AlkB
MILNQRRNDPFGAEGDMKMKENGQLGLFAEAPSGPEGLVYENGFVSAQEEQQLVAKIASLAFAPFQFHGFEGKRNVVSFGWRYGFDGSGLAPTEPMPSFLLPIRARAAAFARLPEEALEQLLVIQYPAGAGIGWHKDRPVFDETIGISLLSDCRFRFRRRGERGWDRFNLNAEARSIYVLRGASRSQWEHSIPEVETLRYSLTFRSLAERL